MPGSRKLMSALASLGLLSLSCGSLLGGSAATLAGTPDGPLGRWIANEQGADLEAIRASLRRVHTGLLPAEVTYVARVIVEESRRANLSPALVLAVIQVESSGYNFARSHAGALGLMQLRPRTAAAVARRIGVRWRGPKTLFDAGTNVRLGVAYLRELMDRYDGDVSTALAAYNWGPTRISSFLRRGEVLPAVYPDRVLSAYGKVTGRAA